jgi:type I site-specific restriction endonuclease
MFPKLSFPEVTFSTFYENGKTLIYDEIRKKKVVLTPEEWVRQHVVHYLWKHRGLAQGRIGVEVSLRYQSLKKRADVVYYNTSGKPALLVECKAPEVSLGQEVLDQAARYNIVLKVPYLLITNGLKHYILEIDPEHESFRFLKSFPSTDEIG